MGRTNSLKQPRRSLARQATWRLVISLALVMLVVAVSAIGVYRQTAAKANSERHANLMGFYAARLSQVERDWELNTRDYRVRIEYTRLLEQAATAELQLQAFLTIQGGNRRFQYLLITDAWGEPRFQFGKELSLKYNPLPPQENSGWYLEPDSRRLYRVFSDPIWLGGGKGRIVLFFAVDNTLLYQMAAPDVSLLISYQDTPIASSEGAKGLAPASQSDPNTPRQPWSAEFASVVTLAIHSPVKPLFTLEELAAAGSLIPLLDGLILWFGLGSWLLLHASRLRQLGQAVQTFAGSHALTEPFRRQIAQSQGRHTDEIYDVADAIETMAEDSVKRQAEREAEEAQRRLMAMVFANSGEGMVITDENNRILAVNQAFSRITGYREADLIGQNPRILSSGMETPDFYQILWRDINDKGGWKGEIRDRRDDGVIVTILLNITAVRTPAGQVVHYVGIFSDITLQKEAEEALRHSRDEMSQANQQLARAARLKDEFMASMSHELRTPLTGVLNLTESLLDETYGKLNPEQIHSLQIIDNSAHHLLNLINDILDLSKLEAGRLELEMQACQVDLICQGAWILMKALAEHKNLRYSCHIDPPNLYCEADSRRLKQILVNLLSNAIKFTPENGAIGLEVEADPKTRQIRFVAWDTGIGIVPEHIPLLFQSFTQLDSSLSRHYEGTGLGLALVRRIAELHGGMVGVESTPGQGSRFSIILPWKEPPPAEMPMPGEIAQATPPTVSIAKKKSGERPLLLLVDDNEVNAMSYQNFLERKGFRVILASWGAEAVRLAQEMRPNLILMDAMMPGMDGIEATRLIRAHADQAIARIPVVMLTGLAMTGDRERCLSSGADDYVSKPVSLKSLLELIQGLLKKNTAKP
jgi:PAS domain S-box-containing protein